LLMPPTTRHFYSGKRKPRLPAATWNSEFRKKPARRRGLLPLSGG
jgi:hypothetical protein